MVRLKFDTHSLGHREVQLKSIFCQSYAQKLMPRKKTPYLNFYPSVTLGLC